MTHVEHPEQLHELFKGSSFHLIERGAYLKHYDIDISYLIYDPELYELLKQILTRRQLQFIEMRYIKNMTVQEIGDVCGVNKSTVSRTLSRARERIQRARRLKTILKY